MSVCRSGSIGRFALLITSVCVTCPLNAAPVAKKVAEKPAPKTAVATKIDSDNPHVWRTRTTSVAVFKNGLGFFLREGEVQLRDRWCLAAPVPPAVFGTLAIYSLDPDEIVDIVGSGQGEVRASRSRPPMTVRLPPIRRTLNSPSARAR